jgi:hypothetical protein
LAFTALALGSGFYALAMLEFTSGSQVAQIWPITLTAATVLLSVAHALILQKYSTRDNPLREFWAAVRKKIHW